MKRTEFVRALQELDLAHASNRTAAALGVGRRQIQRYAEGEQPVPEPVARLLDMYLEHGLPKKYRMKEFWGDVTDQQKGKIL